MPRRYQDDASNERFDRYSTIIGGRLSEARRDRGLTQEELGLRIGRNKPWVSWVERGRIGLTVVDAVAISKALGVSIDFLAGTLDEFAPTWRKPIGQGDWRAMYDGDAERADAHWKLDQVFTQARTGTHAVSSAAG